MYIRLLSTLGTHFRPLATWRFTLHHYLLESSGSLTQTHPSPLSLCTYIPYIRLHKSSRSLVSSAHSSMTSSFFFTYNRWSTLNWCIVFSIFHSHMYYCKMQPFLDALLTMYVCMYINISSNQNSLQNRILYCFLFL